MIVAGKGGVGKTTMTVALAHMAAQAGLSVLVVELEGRPGVATAFGPKVPLDYAGAVLKAAGVAPDGDTGEDPTRSIPPGTVRARVITPDDALLEYLADHGLRRISKRLMSSGIVDLVAGSIPGIRDVLVLGKVKQIERSGIADLVLVDAPATGHTMTFLSSAGGLLDVARSGPIRAQAAEVVDLLSDPSRCQVALVTLPEEMPVNEAIEAAYQLEDKVGIALGPVIVNGCYPTMAGLHTPATVAAEAAGVPLDPRGDFGTGPGPPVPAHPTGTPRGAARTVGPRAPPGRVAGSLPLRRFDRPRRARPPERGAGRRGGGPPRSGRGAVMSPGSSVSSTGWWRSGPSSSAVAPGAWERPPRRRPWPWKRPAGPPGLRGDHRPGASAGQLARVGLALQPAHPHRRPLARGAPRPDARPQGDLRRPDPAVLRQRRAGGGHQGQPDLPEPHRLTLGHPGVHGHGEALRAGRGREVRSGGGGHPADPQRPRLPRCAAAAHPLSGEPGVSGADEADAGRAQGHGGGGPGPAADHLAGGRSRDRARCGELLPGLRGDGGGFRNRAARVKELLVDADTAFVLVASPRPDSVDEAVHFAGKLAESDMAVTALVVNRVQPRFADDAQVASLPTTPVGDPESPLNQLITNLRGYTDASDREEQAYADLVAKVSPAPVYRVPLMNSDVHDLEGLGPSPTCSSTEPVPRQWVAPGRQANLVEVRTILVGSDAPSVRAEVAAIAGTSESPSVRPTPVRGHGRGGRVPTRPGGGGPPDGEHGRDGRVPRATP